MNMASCNLLVLLLGYALFVGMGTREDVGEGHERHERRGFNARKAMLRDSIKAGHAEPSAQQKLPMSDLGEFLKSYKAEAGDEESYRNKMIKLFEVAGPSEAFKKDHIENPGMEKGRFTITSYVVCGDPSSSDYQHVLLMHRYGIWMPPAGRFEEGDTDVIATAMRNVIAGSKLADKPLIPKEQLTPVTPDGLSSPVFDLDVHHIPAEDVYHFDLRVILQAKQCSVVTHDEQAIIKCTPTWMTFEKAMESVSGESVARAVRKLQRFGLLQQDVAAPTKEGDGEAASKTEGKEGDAEAASKTEGKSGAASSHASVVSGAIAFFAYTSCLRQ